MQTSTLQTFNTLKVSPGRFFSSLSWLFKFVIIYNHVHTHRTPPTESPCFWREASLLPAFANPWFCQKNPLFYLPSKLQKSHAIIYILQWPADYNIFLENVIVGTFAVFRFASSGVIIQETVLTKCFSMSWPRKYFCSIPSFLLELENQRESI